jgi:hypothetical protein
MIGIFWIIDNKLVAKKVNLDKVEEINGFRDSGLSHFSEWGKMGLDIHECNKYPRGRVVYHVYEEEFNILVSKEIIENKKYQPMILKEFEIGDNYRFIADEYIKNSKELEILFLKVNEIVREIDPFNIAWVTFDEYYPEVNEIVSKLLENKENEFETVKEVFDKWFFEDETKIEKYKKIAEKIKKDINV